MTKLKEKGITLVALVVTIIILLILAGVTIAQIGGNNGLFNKVRKAVEEYKGAQKNEEMIVDDIETYLGAAQDLESGGSEGSSENIKENVASRDDVLQGKYFYNGDKWQEGEMTDQGSLNKTVPESGSLPLDPGYYSGGTITTTEKTPTKEEFDIELIWQNEKPREAFSAQTLQIDLSKYKMVAFKFYAGINSSDGLYTPQLSFARVGSNTYVGFGAFGVLKHTRSWYEYREVTVSEDSIKIGTGLEMKGGNVISNNADAIPIEIYGVKINIPEWFDYNLT